MISQSYQVSDLISLDIGAVDTDSEILGMLISS